MKISKLKLTNFRNWPEASFEFSDRVLIYGSNAQGKTNILEALYILATTRSFKGKAAEVIQNGCDFLRIEGLIEKEKPIEVAATYQKIGDKVEKEFQIAQKKRPSIDFVGNFSAIVFSPDDLSLISGPPELKRRYLSFTIGQTDREYLFDLLNYKKILKQRNELLKKADLGTIRDEIDIWDKTLSENGQKVIDARRKLAEYVNQKFSDYYKDLTGEDRTLEFVYEPGLTQDNLADSLKEVRDKDIWEKNTTVGPHRDSLSILIDGKRAEKYASRGEYRTIILALKLCERDWMTDKDKEPPVVLLDDVFSELDEQRRKYLVKAFQSSQLIITTTDLDHLDPELQVGTQLINIEGEKKVIENNQVLMDI
jgi:DNA replication and repair protein RecF